MDQSRRAILIAAVIAAAASVFFAVPRGRPRITVDFFSVGQGDSMLVSTGWSQILIDAGPDRTILSRLGRAMPFFDRTIEQVVITHPHADHYLGLVPVLERYRVRQVLLPANRIETPDFRDLIRRIKTSGADVVEVGAGDRLRVGAAEFELLWPPPSVRPPPGSDESVAVNGLSLVMRLTAFCGAGGPPVPSPECGAVLFTGDATLETENGLMAAGAPLAARILKVGHHGSDRSTSAAWLRAVRPELAVIEVGHNNYGHPALALLRRLRAAGASVWRTDRDGDLRAVFIQADQVGGSPPFVWRPE